MIQKDIMKQIRLLSRRNKSYFIILLLLMYSCNTINTKDAINYFQDNLIKNEKKYQYTNKKINEIPCDYPFGLEGIRAKQIFYIDSDNGHCPKLKDQEFAHFLWKFVRKEYLGIGVYEDVIRYSYSHIRNKNLTGYHLLYLKTDKKNGYYFNKLKQNNYKFYETNNIPSEIDVWVYHLKGKWYLQSPFNIH